MDGSISSLLQLPAERRLLKVANSPSLLSDSFVRSCLIEASRLRSTDLPKALAVAGLGVAAAEGIQQPSAAVFDLRAEALATYGNLSRISGDLYAASKFLARADHSAAQGSGQPVLIAEIFERISSLREAQRRFSEALVLLKKARSLHEQSGHSQAVARTLISEAIVVGYAGDPEMALRLLTTASGLIDFDDSLRLALPAAHNTSWFLVDLGFPQHAMRAYKRAAPLYPCDQATQPKRAWLEGHIHAGLSLDEIARHRFREAQAAYLMLNQPHEGALVSLELAELEARSGRWAELEELAAEIQPIFRSLGIGREARASLLLQKACARRRTAIQLLRKASLTIRFRARR